VTVDDAGVVLVLDVFCNESEAEVRVRAAEVVARMAADRLVGGRVRIHVAKFLPALFADAMRDAAAASVRLFDSNSENPELIWTDEMRSRLCAVLRRVRRRRLDADADADEGGGGGGEWTGLDAADESELPNLDAEPSVAGVYLRLLAANPGWMLRRPKEILGELVDAALHAAVKEPVRLFFVCPFHFSFSSLVFLFYRSVWTFRGSFHSVISVIQSF